MEFRILGPLEVIGGRSSIRVGGRMQRTLLARLIVQRNGTVPAATLVEDIWEQPPPSASQTLQAHVSNLRKQLPNIQLHTDTGGYRLIAAPGTVDLDRFEELLANASNGGAAAGSVETFLKQALDLWRGPALEEFRHLSWATVESARLEGLREVAIENLVEARLARGDNGLLIPELEALVSEHPLREKMWGQLMLALYRAGRQADALRTYARLRSILREELGVDPSSQLASLERAILTHDVSLEWKPPSGVSHSLPAAGQDRPRQGKRAASFLADLPGDQHLNPTYRTPLNVPTLARPRLLETMAGRFDRRATLLVAPAGYGKSTLVRQAIDDNASDPRGEDVWIPLATEHRSPSVLVSAVANRLGIAYEEGADFDVTRGIDAIVSAVWSRAPRQVALILDDLHLIAPSEASTAVVNGLMRALPSNGHLVLTSRHDMAVSVSRLLLLGEAVKITEQDLRFDRNELDELGRGRQVSREVLDLSGGWPALAVLLSVAGYDGPAERVGLDFVWEEVLSSFDAQRRADLCRLAVAAGVYPIDEEIASAAIGRSVDLEVALDQLPLVSSVDRRYFLHALWRRAFPPDRFDLSIRAGAGQRIADLLRSRSEFESAVVLYQEFENWPAVLSVIVETCAIGRPAVAIDVLEEWRKSIPPAWSEAPELAMLDAVILAASDRREASALFAHAASRFRELKDPNGELACLTQRGVVAMWIGDLSAGLEVYERVKELLAAGDITDDDFVRVADVFMAHTAGDWERVLVTTEPILHREIKTDLDIGGRGFRAFALTGLGQHQAAEEVVAGVADRASPAVKALCLQALALARWMLRDPSDSLPEALHLIQVSDDIGMTDHRVANRAIAATLYARCLEIGAAERLVAEVQEILATRSAGVLAELRLALARAEIAIARGEEDAAAQLLNQMLIGNPIGSPGTGECYHDSLAHIYIVVPETRPVWDRANLGGRWIDCLAVARALVEVREEDRLELVSMLRPDVILGIRPHLSTDIWLELCIAAAAAGILQLEQFSNEVSGPGREAVRRLSATAMPAVRQTADALLARIPKPPAQTVAVRVLGPTEVWRGGVRRRQDGWDKRMSWLFVYLLAHPSATDSSVIADLWPEQDPTLARLSFLETLNSLEQVLDPDYRPGEASCFIRHEDGHIRLERSVELDIDLWRCQDLLASADAHEREGDPGAALHSYLAALDLYRSPFLYEVRNESWATQSYARSLVDFVATCARAGELLLASGRSTEALQLARRAIDADRASERAWRLEAAALFALGDRAAALASLSQCRMILAELGIETEPESEQLDRSIRRSPNERPANPE